MAIVISFGNRKGGVGKSMTCGITSFLLSRKYRVLAVDFDSQGNVSQLLSQRSLFDFDGRTVYEVLTDEMPIDDCIYPVSDTLHLLPSGDLLAILSRYLYGGKYKGNPATLLRDKLAEVQDRYEFITLDLPPSLGDLTLNALSMSDWGLIMLQAEPFAYEALERYLGMMQQVHDRVNPNLKVLGILTSLTDARASLDTAIIDKAREEYGDLVFNSVIRRRSRIKEFAIEGIQDRTKADKAALEMYEEFVKEMLQRVQKR